MTEHEEDLISLNESFNSSSLQYMYEALLRQFKSSNNDEAVKELNPLRDDVGDISQKLFVRLKQGHKIPYIGAGLMRGDTSAQHMASIYEGRPFGDIGSLLCANLTFSVNGERRSISGGSEWFDQLGVSLLETYRDPILQAASNIYKKEIYFSEEIGYFSPRKSVLLKEGFAIVPGYDQSVYKIYKPQIA